MAGSSTAGWAEADRGDPMVSAGSAGTPSTIVASTAAGPTGSFAAPAGARFAAGAPFAAAVTPLAGASLPGTSAFALAGVPFGETPAAAVPADAASSRDAVLARADLAAVGVRDGCLGGAMMSL